MKAMEKNEKLIRMGIGLAGIGAGFYYQNWWIGGAGTILLISGITGICFLKALFGKGCCHSEKKSEAKHDHHDHGGGCCGHQHQ